MWATFTINWINTNFSAPVKCLLVKISFVLVELIKVRVKGEEGGEGVGG